MTRRSRTGALVVACAIALAGCAGGDAGGPAGVATADPSAVPTAAPSAPVPSGSSTGPDLTVPDDDLPGAVVDPRADVARGSAPGTLLVTTWGSSSCPVLPGEPRWETPGERLVVPLDRTGEDGPCTSDLGPTDTELAVPDLPDGAFVVVLGGTEVAVPPAG